jgi:type I restriction enzyme S subunit
LICFRIIQEKPVNWNINESVFTLRPNFDLVTSEFSYLLLSAKELKVFTKNASAGSVHKGIRIGVLNTFKLPYGGEQIILGFSQKIKPILSKIHTISRENQQLAELRDWLLPMLMNGQVKVENASLEV